jgi:type I restriction enzyme S subunit
MVGKVADHYVASGVTYLVSKNVRRNRLDLREVSYVTKDFHQAHRKSQLQPYDLLTVQSGHVGETCVVPPELGEANCHAIIITTPKLDVVDPFFVAFYLNSHIGQQQLRRLVIGSTLQHINTSELQELKIPIPPLQEQRMISLRMRQADNQVAACTMDLAAVTTLRSELLCAIF